MKHAKLLCASAIAAAAWCAAPQAQTILYGVDIYEFGAGGTGTTPELSNTSPYPKHPGNVGYAVSEYWDNGMLWQRRDPVVIDSRGNASYVYPETARFVPPPKVVVEPLPYGERVYDYNYRVIR
jgi:hypothetical protein